MLYSSHLLVKAFIIVASATWGSCWQYFTPLSDIALHNSMPELTQTHSEYRYGCRIKRGRVLYNHMHVDHMDLLGKKIFRAWINVMRIPTCIILRAKSFEIDLIRSSTYKFQICVPRITYTHSHKRFKFFYLEWYIPEDYAGGMNWDLYFFGSPERTWQ